MDGGPDWHPELPLAPDPSAVSPAPAPLHLRADAVLLVAAGGLVGTLARYGLAELDPTPAGHWPWATFVANLAGAFVLGLLLELLALSGPDHGGRQRIRLLLGTGFCGALTTFSTLAVETDLLAHDHHLGVAAGYLVATAFGGLLATLAGIAAGGRPARARGAGR
jgi:fluoride exporter